MLDKQTRQLINAARVLGSHGRAVYLEDDELIKLCGLIATDLGQATLFTQLTGHTIHGSYYALPLAWFTHALHPTADFAVLFTTLQQAIPDFATYFRCLCELHKRRKKFALILQQQPLPEIDQMVPRCLLEYGLQPADSLASWLVWRKWVYDVDNRAAQETGYLFEPILTAALGGVAYSAAKSPIKRANTPHKGRQVDCLDGKYAYEFKMRVTIAASGQGRFQEELDFARDCHYSGYIPVLLVLDATDSPKLTELRQAYETYHGLAYIGEAAWAHITAQAGSAMGYFIHHYIQQPFGEVGRAFQQLKPLTLRLEGEQIQWMFNQLN